MPARAPRVTRSEAVVIRHRRFGDSDRIVTLLTPARGKLDAIAKGALRPRSRLAGHLEPLTHAEVLLAHGRNLDIITQAQTIEGFGAIRDDLDRLSLALYLLELADRLTVEHAEADAVYRLLLIALLRLARGDGQQIVARSFELGLLDATGFGPQWRDCAACREAVSPDAPAWSPLAGGVICAACRASHPEAGPIDLSVLKVLRFIQQEPYEEAARVRLTPELASRPGTGDARADARDGRARPGQRALPIRGAPDASRSCRRRGGGGLVGGLGIRQAGARVY